MDSLRSFVDEGVVGWMTTILTADQSADE